MRCSVYSCDVCPCDKITNNIDKRHKRPVYRSWPRIIKCTLEALKWLYVFQLLCVSLTKVPKREKLANCLHPIIIGFEKKTDSGNDDFQYDFLFMDHPPGQNNRTRPKWFHNKKATTRVLNEENQSDFVHHVEFWPFSRNIMLASGHSHSNIVVL